MVAAGEAPVEHMPAVLGVGPHLARPAPLIDRVRPALAGEERGAVELVERVVPGLVVEGDRLPLAADDHRQLLPLEAGDGDDAGHGQQEWHVLLVVDVVEELLLGGLDVHAGREQIGAQDRHGFAPPGSVVVSTVASGSPRRAGAPSARPSSRPAWPGPGTSAPPTPARPDRATGPAARAWTA